MSDASSGLAVRGASLLILLQVVSRALTFTANQVLLRFMTAQLLGVSAQLEVYYLSVLFFARESLRVAIQRQGSETRNAADGKEKAGKPAATTSSPQAAVNISYLAITLGAIVAMVLGQLYVSSVGASSVAATPHLLSSLYLYAFAAMVELLSEPAFVVMQIRLQFRVRATAEAVATFMRCAMTLGSAVWASKRGLELGVMPFALGQAMYGLALLGVYAWYGFALAGKEKFSLFPVRLTKEEQVKEKGKAKGSEQSDYVLSYFSRPTLQLAGSMMAQSLVKHVLTQGDTFLVSVLSTTTAQGVYALANNYGGLVARLVFQPIEESSRSYFSRLLSTSSSSQQANEPSKPSVQKARADLQALIKVYTMLSLVVVTLGPTAAPLLLSLVAGPRWASSGAGACLSAYAWYIPLLAVNGVAEAFVASVASEAEVHKQSAWMTAFSLVFAAAGYVFLRVLDMGAVGLVLANGVNMLCRIVWCAVFITGYFRRLGVEFELREILPEPRAVLNAALASYWVARVVKLTAGEVLGTKEILIQLAKVGVVALPYLAVEYVILDNAMLRGHYILTNIHTGLYRNAGFSIKDTERYVASARKQQCHGPELMKLS
jgi:oligosaccharide translocation protein RFT1